MKLASLEIDPARIEDGAWVEIIPDCGDLRIRTRGLQNADYRRLYARLSAAVPGRARRGLSQDETDRIVTECLVETCLLEWQNIEDLPYSKEAARKALFDPRYRILREACLYAAAEVANMRAEDEEADLKN